MSICNRILATQTGRYRIKIPPTVTMESANNWISDNLSSTHLTHHEESSWAQQFPPRGPPTNRPIEDSCYCLLPKTVMHPSPHPQTCYHFLSHFPAGANKLKFKPSFYEWGEVAEEAAEINMWQNMSCALSHYLSTSIFNPTCSHTLHTHSNQQDGGKARLETYSKTCLWSYLSSVGD